MKLTRTFGLWSSISLVVGGIIGSGIFMKPALMASQLGSPLLLIGVWIAAGLLTLCGALTNAEVAAMIPETGGQYIFFQKMYGDFVAFLYGWAAFCVFNTAGIASIAYVLVNYVEYFITLPRLGQEAEQVIHLFIPGIGTIYPFENIGVKSFTIAVVGGLTWVNYRSVQSGGNLQVLFTFLKIGAMGLLMTGLFFSGQGSWTNVTTSSSVIHPTGMALVLAIIAAMSGAFWGYDGWNNITFVGGEIQNPQKNIPRSMILGLIMCIAIYALITLAYTYILPIDVVAQSVTVASDAAQKAFGIIGGSIIAIMVIISTFGTTNGNILATARVSFAMAQEKRFFPSVGVVHPLYKSPGNALIIQGTWASLLVLSGSFDMLTDMSMFVSWLFYGLSAVGVFVLRKKMPYAERPYKAWGYPYVPAFYILATFLFLILTITGDVSNYLEGRTPLINSLFGLLLTAIGIPLYFYFKRLNNKQKTLT